MAKARDAFPFEFVIMLGDNIYGSERPQDFVRKFEKPYEALLSAKVPFYASLGNHDDPTQASCFPSRQEPVRLRPRGIKYQG